MKHRIIRITIYLLLTAIVTQAQVHGIVKDKSGSPITGCNLFWSETTQGTTTGSDGSFTLTKPTDKQKLIASFVGYENDTILVKGNNERLNITLHEGVELNEVTVVSRKVGTAKLRGSAMNVDVISSTELLRAACCNLGESFTTNPSVDVAYSDAATGAKEIKFLGLSGTHVQMLTENIPNFRGTASPYSLGYVPGPWMQSIQVSKGSSSVKNGYEAITGQINVEFKKPQNPDADWFSGNLYTSSTGRYEANADATIKLSNKWSTSLLAHYENETMSHDSNHDGFEDIPQVKQYNVWNRWSYLGEHYVFQAGIKALSETRNSGQMSHSDNNQIANPYQIGIETNRYEAFTKNAYIFNKEKNTNVALILSGSLHQQDADYGLKKYNVDQNNVYASLMFETELSKHHSLSTGLSFNYDSYNQHYRFANDASLALTKDFTNESVPGAYIQYTYNLNDKLVLMAGLRGDHSNEYGYFVTPRFHAKYNPNEYIHFRLSAGKGYRTNHILAENNYLLASSRKISIADHLNQDEAWNYGTSTSAYIPLFGKTLNLNAEYYYTDFQKQVIVDMNSDPHSVLFYNLDGRSYSHALQLEATYPFFTGFTFTAAYRWTDVKSTYNGQLMRKPLTSKYKGLLTASYQTPLALWQFDVTLQLNGGGLMPTPYKLNNGNWSWGNNYKGFEQLSAQITRYFRHWSIYAGGENLTNFKQKNPIIDAGNPWSDNFDATMVWGPMHGATVYIGIRYNIPRI